MEKSNIYTTVRDLVTDSKLGQHLVIDLPENLLLFRKYLADFSKYSEYSFRSKVIGGKLHIKVLQKIEF